MSSRRESRVRADRALFASSLWLRVGFIGASAAATGLVGLTYSYSNSLSALALVISGVVLAVAGWHRGRRVLERVERADPVRPSRNVVLSPERMERWGQP